MKPSKTQRDILDKLRRGWVLAHHNTTGRAWLLKSNFTVPVGSRTFDALRRAELIEIDCEWPSETWWLAKEGDS